MHEVVGSSLCLRMLVKLAAPWGGEPERRLVGHSQAWCACPGVVGERRASWGEKPSPPRVLEAVFVVVSVCLSVHTGRQPDHDFQIWSPQPLVLGCAGWPPAGLSPRPTA